MQFLWDRLRVRARIWRCLYLCGNGEKESRENHKYPHLRIPRLISIATVKGAITFPKTWSRSNLSYPPRRRLDGDTSRGFAEREDWGCNWLRPVCLIAS